MPPRGRPAGPGEGRALTGAQMDLLLGVVRNPDQTVTQVAARLRLARNTVSTLVGQLARAGLLVTRLNPSGAAAQRMATWRARRAAVVQESLTSLDARDVAALERALGPMRALAAAMDAARARDDEAWQAEP